MRPEAKYWASPRADFQMESWGFGGSAGRVAACWGCGEKSGDGGLDEEVGGLPVESADEL
jgi:hypothetical protein